MIRAIAFDWGGIFTEGTFDSAAVADLADRTGLAPEHVAATYYPLMADFEVGAFDMATFHRLFREGTGSDVDAAAFETTFLGAVRERLAMFAVLGGIPADYRVGVLSNNVPVLCDRVRDDPRMARVERFVFSNEIALRKPDPRAFAALTEALDVPAEATVFVDDSAANIEAARALGFHGIHLNDLGGFLAQWRRLLPDLPTGLAIDDA